MSFPVTDGTVYFKPGDSIEKCIQLFAQGNPPLEVYVAAQVEGRDVTDVAIKAAQDLNTGIAAVCSHWDPVVVGPTAHIAVIDRLAEEQIRTTGHSYEAYCADMHSHSKFARRHVRPSGAYFKIGDDVNACVAQFADQDTRPSEVFVDATSGSRDEVIKTAMELHDKIAKPNGIMEPVIVGPLPDAEFQICEALARHRVRSTDQTYDGHCQEMNNYRAFCDKIEQRPVTEKFVTLTVKGKPIER